MKENEKNYKIGMMCQVLSVSRSSYYRWKQGQYVKREDKKSEYKKVIESKFIEHRHCYGSPRIAKELTVEGFSVSQPTVALYMRSMGLKSKRNSLFRQTTNSGHSYNCFDNLLDRNFIASDPNTAWVSDITYIHTLDGFLYLTTIIDLFDRKIVGWSVSTHLTAEKTVISAFNMAIKNRKPSKGLLFHSDRGIQYACSSCTNLLASYKIKQSMSRKGNCWDNAVAESFFKTLKAELIYGNKLVSKEIMTGKLFEYVEVYYNKKRRHSSLGLLTIEEFTKKYEKTNN
jgi:transposase InsO family protein